MSEIKPAGVSTPHVFPRGALGLALLASLAAFYVVLSGQGHSYVQRAEQFYSDLRTSLLSDRTSTDHPDIVLVSIGDNVTPTRSTFSQRAEVDYGTLARLITSIDEAAPRAIGLDVSLIGPTDPVKDQALQRALREAKSRVVIGIREDRGDVSAERRGWRERLIMGTGRATGHISSLYEGSRVAYFDSGTHAISGTPDSFALLIARALRPEVRRSFDRIAWLQRVDESGWFTRYINFGAQQPFTLLYGDDILDPAKPMPARRLAGRLVLVTSGFAELERHRTPLSLWSGEAVPPIQIQAQAIAQLLDGRKVAEWQPPAIRLALFSLAMLGGVIGWYRRPGWHIGGRLLLLAALVLVDAFAYAWLDLVLPFVMAAMVWFLGEATGRSLRRILDWEERFGQRWPMEKAKAS